MYNHILTPTPISIPIPTPGLISDCVVCASLTTRALEGVSLARHILLEELIAAGLVSHTLTASSQWHNTEGNTQKVA
jgi:hypothetical protein